MADGMTVETVAEEATRPPVADGQFTLVASANLIKKVYFPRLVVPLSAVISGGVDFALTFVVLLGMMLFYGIVSTAAVIWLPLFLLLALADRRNVFSTEVCRSWDGDRHVGRGMKQ